MKPRRTFAVPTGGTPIHLFRQVKSAHFRERAKFYRYAAALADDRQNVVQFCELAFMFERIALKLCDRWKT
jgi:hypothetical protein